MLTPFLTLRKMIENVFKISFRTFFVNRRNDKQRSATIKDVAREAGVSYATVSRVLNDYEHVKPDKRQRVLEAMDRLGYQVNLQARSLVVGRSQLVGMLVHNLGNNPYAAQIVQGIDQELALTDYNLVLYTTHQNTAKEVDFVDNFTQRMVDGLVLVIPLNPETYLPKLRERGFPYVIIADTEKLDPFSPMVGITNHQGVYDGMRYLIELGHERIGYISGHPLFLSAAERFEAYKAALADHGLRFDPDLVRSGAYQYRPAYEATHELMRLPNPPTAIFAANDLSAQGVYDAARSLELRIPDQLSVVGYDDVPQAAFLYPPLTTVRQPLLEMGRGAARLLLDMIANPGQPVQSVLYETSLIVRDSCQPPRQRMP
jgi:LacI family transcriptional regulator